MQAKQHILIKFVAVILQLSLTACAAVVNEGVSVTLPLPNNDYRGRIETHHSAAPIQQMEQQCASFGGLIQNSVISHVPAEVVLNLGGQKVHEYQCVGPYVSPAPIYVAPSAPSPEVLRSSSVDGKSIADAKRKCAALGFVRGTPKFGQCVLKVSE